MKTVNDLLDFKGRDVLSIGANDTVYDAILMMAQHEIGALAVMDHDKLAGIISERDYARKIILQDRSSRSTLVSDVMTADLVTADPQETIEDCMHMMTENRIRHLPVVNGDELEGMISIGDLIKEIINDQQITIEFLESYITA
jgi:CBS domain-containing protein